MTAPQSDDDAHVLCTQCRSVFTDAEIAGKSACPKCGNKGMPADLRHKATLTLTHAEWRVLFIWADRWATERAAPDDKPGYNSPGLLRALRAEAKRQAPDLPSLSLFEDVQEVATALGKSVELHGPDGQQKIEPERKH